METFEPINYPKVNMYVCGPTVYDHIHIGNARPVIVFDTVKRVLTAFGYDVHMVSNITDVDDKIIDKAKALNISEKTLTETYIEAYKDMTNLLGSQLPDAMPKATEYIESMIHYIQRLIEKGFAYETQEGVYFRVNKINDYGVLSKQKQDQLETAVRVDLDQQKEHTSDFSIWKKTNDGLHFDSPWGAGRPGWHTECAVMNHEIFNGMIDIHGGGSDLKFPHHENERAHAQAHDHHGLAKYWMHNGRLDLQSEKMSKSLGNIILVKDLNKHDLGAFRMLMLAHHYRQPINYSQQLFDEYLKIYQSMNKKLKMTTLELMLAHIKTSEIDADIQDKTLSILEKDFDTPNVITELYQLLKQLNKTGISIDKAVLLNTIVWQISLLGIQMDLHIEQGDVDLYDHWKDARLNKDFDLADNIRRKLMEKGYL
jgi:cysteinyl-tRNA synthetase